jgi:hypothetical protein
LNLPPIEQRAVVGDYEFDIAGGQSSMTQLPGTAKTRGKLIVSNKMDESFLRHVHLLRMLYTNVLP